jgi:hypothetical protein
MINKMFLDSLDEYYSIDHNEPEPKAQQKPKRDYWIGVITLILIFAFILPS